MIWQARDNLVVKWLYGKAFRAPSFFEHYLRNTTVGLGNPNIKPEEIETFEIGFDYRVTDALNLTLNLYHYDIEDKIDANTETENGVAFQYDNFIQLEGRGLELEARWKPTRQTSILFNYSYQQLEEQTPNFIIKPAPAHSVFVRGDYML